MDQTVVVISVVNHLIREQHVISTQTRAFKSLEKIKSS